MRWDDFLTENPTFFLFLDKKDRFTELGKSSQNKRFVFRWGIVPPFARNPHTSIFRFTQKTIKNEQTTTAQFLAVFKKCCQDLDNTF